MPGIITISPDNPDFARVVPASELRPGRTFDFEVSPDEAEAARLARLLDARSVRKMRFKGTIRAAGSGWLLEGALGATVVQSCIVTLDPLTTRIDVPVRRRFLPMDVFGSEVNVSPEEDDEIEPLDERIDLGLVATEALALALPAYPRKADAPDEPHSAVPAGAVSLGGNDEKPFASLAELRDRMSKKE